MNLQISKGKYVLAVSGGVDSVVLLDLLVKKPEVKLVVAHFDHGMRPGSAKDATFVARLAKKYNVPAELGSAKLGKTASEEAARNARYKFLRGVRTRCKAKSIITAHHQDDLIETAFINLLRGSGPKGLVAIAQNKNILRPLLNVPKNEILAYASTHRLKWREDPTNNSTDYLRNYLRLKVIPVMTQEQREQMLKNIDKVAINRRQKDQILATLSRLLLKDNHINRRLYLQLPTDTGRELLANWLRNAGYNSYDRRKLVYADMALRVGGPNTSYALSKNVQLKLKAATAQLTNGLI